MQSHTSAGSTENVVKNLLALTKSVGLKSHYEVKWAQSEATANGRSEEDDYVEDDIGVSISPEADSIRLTPLIDDRLGLILNENQEIELGDSIYRVQNDYTFIFKKDDKSQLKSFYEDLRDGKVAPPTGYDPLTYESIRVYKTETKFSNLEEQEGGRAQWELTCGPHGLNDTWRVGARMYSHWSYFYASAGIEVTSNGKRRRCKFLSGCWHTWDVPRVADLQMNYDICVYINNVARQHDYGQLRGFTSHHSRFQGELFGVSVSRLEINGWVCAKGTLSGQTLRCSVNRTYLPPAGWYRCPVANQFCP